MSKLTRFANVVLAGRKKDKGMFTRMLQGAAAPNGAVTAGRVGQLYERTGTGVWYICTVLPNTWVAISA